MEIKLNGTIYEKSKDKNIVYQYQLNRQEIRINELEKEITELEHIINIDPVIGIDEEYPNN